MITIKDLLNKFNLNITLSEKVLNIEIEGDYNTFDKDKLIFHSDSKGNFNYFECFVFKGGECVLFIVPSNKEENIVFRKKLNNLFIGYSYNSNGDISYRI